jgi:thiol:disulfide interchange protein DsbD
MTRRSPRPRPGAWPLLLICLAALWPLSSAGAADVLSVEVTPQGGRAEIGANLVLEIAVAAASGPAPALADITVEVTTADGTSFFTQPYPLRALEGRPGDADAIRVEWAAPVPSDVKPVTADLVVAVAARLPDGGQAEGRWQGQLEVGFGEKWNANRIQVFIEERGFAFFLLLVFGFGILMSLSPCIYPMIPITLAVIGARNQEKGWLNGLIMSVTYVVGMALVYAILGALAATVFSGITAFMQSPVVVVPIAVLLLVLSLSMFGAFELQAPGFLRDRLGGPGGGRGGLVGAFLMGMVAGLVASPCVGPFLGALLLWVGTTGNWVWGFFALFTFGMGMGLLLIGVGTFPALWGSMPGSGGWMDTVKRAMGLLLVAMALYFVRPGAVLPESVFYPLVGVTAVLVAVFVGAFDGLTPESGWWPRTRKALGLIVFTGGLYLVVGSFLQYGLLMPSPLKSLHLAAAAPAVAQDPTPATAAAEVPAEAPLPDKVPWQVLHAGAGLQAKFDALRAEAKAAGRPVVVDFWAEWCFYCKKLDKDVWKHPDVVRESLRFTAVKIDATPPDDAEMEALKASLQVPGMPAVVFIDSRGELLAGLTSGYVPPEEMLGIMQGVR